MPISLYALLVGLWALIVGTRAKLEVYAGLIAAAIATAAFEIVRAQGVFRFQAEGRWLARTLLLPVWTVFDFGVVTIALVKSLARGKRVEGVFLAVPFPAGDKRARYAFRRALATTAGTIDANAIVVDIDEERGFALLHSMEPRVKTGHEVL